MGLGNPGILYAASRHNIGFTVVKALAKDFHTALKKDRSVRSFTGTGIIENNRVLLAMPVTFMNLSGSAVAGLLGRYALGLGELLVVCDDLDLEFGRIRIRPSGSSGGHRGLQSIIDALGSNEFSRLRIGIGRPLKRELAEADFVLSSFSRKEKIALKETLPEAVSCCTTWIAEGVTEAMNKFNRKGNSQ